MQIVLAPGLARRYNARTTPPEREGTQHVLSDALDVRHDVGSITEAVIVSASHRTSPLGEAVRTLRQARRWSQRDLAARAGIGLRTIIRLEAEGQRNTFDVISRIAKAFELHETELLIFQSSHTPPALLHGTREQRMLRRMWLALFKRPHTTEEPPSMGSLQSSLTDALAHPPAGMEDLQVITNPRLQPLLPLLRALRVNPDGMLLVVSSHQHDLSKEVRESDRVIVWGDSALRVAHQRMPASVVAVLFVTFPDHRGTANVTRQARTLGAATHHQTVTARTVHELCEEAGLFARSNDNDETMTTTTYQDAKTGKLKVGALATFLHEHAEWWPTSPPAEIVRLAELAQQRGLVTTQGSIAQAYYKTRRDKRKAGEGPRTAIADAEERIETHDTSTPTVDDATTTEASAAPVETSTPTVDSPLLRELEALLGMLDDSVASLQLTRETLGRMAPRIAEVFAGKSETDELRAKLALMQRTFSTLFESAAAGDNSRS